MNKVDKHGLKMENLRHISGITYDSGRDHYFQIWYNKTTGRFGAEEFIGNGWVPLDDDEVEVCCARRHWTMQEIADRTAEAVAQDGAMADADGYYY